MNPAYVLLIISGCLTLSGCIWEQYTINNTVEDPKIVAQYCRNPEGIKDGDKPLVMGGGGYISYGFYEPPRYSTIEEANIPLFIQKSLQRKMKIHFGSIHDQLKFEEVEVVNEKEVDKSLPDRQWEAPAYSFYYTFDPSKGYPYHIKFDMRKNGSLLDPINFPCVGCDIQKEHFASIQEIRAAARSKGFDRCVDEWVVYDQENDEISFVYRKPRLRGWDGVYHTALIVSVHNPEKTRIDVQGPTLYE